MLIIAWFVVLKPLSYCFEETKGFEVKAWFASRPVSFDITNHNKSQNV